jgi:endonuclease/exonuclease/phosphatase family metal-dependent hydrolase
MNRLLLQAACACLLSLFVFPSYAQISRVGSNATFDVATWNTEWFGAPGSGPNNDALQVQNVKDIMEGSEIELWAVQEISNLPRFDELMNALGPDWQGQLATNSGSQRIGFVWDTRVVTKRSISHILESFSTDFAGRPPLKGEFLIALPDTSMIVTLINVHMKAFGDADSYQKRVNASARVKNHIDFSSLASASVVFLGDMNDELLSSTYANQVSPYQNFVSDTANYLAVSLPLEVNDRFSWIGGSPGSNLDHIIISKRLAASYIPGSGNTMDGLKSLIGFTAQTSDHVPVYASFGSSVVLDTEDENAVPAAFSVLDLYPNPATREVSLTIASPRPAEARFEIYNSLGQLILREDQDVAAGSQTVTLTWDELPSGMYFVRIASGSSAQIKPLLVVR